MNAFLSALLEKMTTVLPDKLRSYHLSWLFKRILSTVSKFLHWNVSVLCFWELILTHRKLRCSKRWSSRAGGLSHPHSFQWGRCHVRHWSPPRTVEHKNTTHWSEMSMSLIILSVKHYSQDPVIARFVNITFISSGSKSIWAWLILFSWSRR